ncbi:MAG: GTPase HflX [Chloroflexi bacterium]|nr:GTPase HflX [Chloroflexota bacterium]MBM3175519.1 GTPase HflX [Chloroflexota bacterium]MBM4450132.1 GTPase HflX [Chloroflexota bacterium]
MSRFDRQTFPTTQAEPEQAFLVGVEPKNSDSNWPIEGSMAELSYLAQTAGAQVVGKLTQKVESPSPSHYLGKGKLKELIAIRQQYPYSVVIFNDELSPRQQRNLEDALQVKVIDRTALILDIFARRAKTREGQLQVELAQHQYLLPRLAGQWSHLERLGGGIGTRGPGESQLETDRRLIRNRIHRLNTQIEAVRQHRALYRQKRKKNRIPVVALVGYTNAGKSTLLNALSNAGVPVENRLFSTLDPVTRRLTLPDKRYFLLTDTVGFIHKLPPSIVAAFRATLEELEEADLLLHIVDITHINAPEQFQTVEKILADLHLDTKPRLVVVNKLDLVVQGEAELKSISLPLTLPHIQAVMVSAYKAWGLDELLHKIAEYLDIAQPSETRVRVDATAASRN